MDANALNYIVIASLAFFGVALGGLVWALLQLVPQISKTLNAYEHLAGTLEGELTPTLREVNKVIVSISELKTIATRNVTEVTTKVEDVTGSLTKSVDTAKKHSSVWGAGFMAAAKSYLEGSMNHQKDASDKDHRNQRGHDGQESSHPKRISRVGGQETEADGALSKGS